MNYGKFLESVGDLELRLKALKLMSNSAANIETSKENIEKLEKVLPLLFTSPQPSTSSNQDSNANKQARVREQIEEDKDSKQTSNVLDNLTRKVVGAMGGLVLASTLFFRGPTASSSTIDQKDLSRLEKQIQKQIDSENSTNTSNKKSSGFSGVLNWFKKQKVKDLTELIYEGEGTTDEIARQKGFKSGYDVPYGYGAYAMPEKPLTEMFITEVQEFQKKQIRATEGKVPGTTQGTGAVGKPQFTQTTLARLVTKAGIDPSTTKFTPEVQENLKQILINEAVAQGGDVANNLAGIWASLPTDKGIGAYTGQSARVQRKKLEEAVAKIAAEPPPNVQRLPTNKNAGTVINQAGDIENESSGTQIIIVNRKNGGAQSPPIIVSSTPPSKVPTTDKSGPTRVLAGLNAID